MKYNVIFILTLLCAFSIYCSGMPHHAERPAKQRSERHSENAEPGKKAHELYIEGRLDEADEILKRIIAQDPGNVSARELAALIAFKRNDLTRAENLAKSVLQIDQKSSRAHLVLAGVLRKTGKQLLAMHHVKEAKKCARNPQEKEELHKFINDYRAANRTEFQPAVSTENTAITADRPFLAVFPFKDLNTKPDNSGFGQSVSEMLITALIQTNRFRVLERNQLDKIIGEQALGQTGMLDEETSVQVGELIGVDAVVLGSASRLRQSLELDARIIGPESGEALTAVSASIANESALRDAINEMAQKIANFSGKIPVKKNDEKLK